MKTTFGHIQFNIDLANQPFYLNLFIFLGWRVIHQEPAYLGIASKDGASLWFSEKTKPGLNDYDANGINHVALNAESIADVGRVAAYLHEIGVDTLFNTPRHRPEFRSATDHTYYQVMFESPDGILFEVVYIGPL